MSVPYSIQYSEMLGCYLMVKNLRSWDEQKPDCEFWTGNGFVRSTNYMTDSRIKHYTDRKDKEMLSEFDAIQIIENS